MSNLFFISAFITSRWYGEKKDLELRADHERHAIQDQMKELLHDIDQEDLVNQGLLASLSNLKPSLYLE